MKSQHLLGVAAVLGLFISLTCSIQSPASNSPVPQRQIISCSSDNMKRNYCDADVSAGVTLVKQRSDAPCTFNRTWGYDNRRGIWVDRGCRADFQIGSDSNGPDNVSTIYCASDDGRRNFCAIDTRGGVQMVRKRSDASCEYGNSWGYDRGGVWVDRGCRADFQIGGGGGDRDWDRRRDRDEDRDRDRDSGGVQIVSCSSDDMGRRDCRVETRGGVRLVRQRSEADCVFGRTWGYDRHSIWVDRGCRADFEVGARR